MLVFAFKNPFLFSSGLKTLSFGPVLPEEDFFFVLVRAVYFPLSQIHRRRYQEMKSFLSFSNYGEIYTSMQSFLRSFYKRKNIDNGDSNQFLLYLKGLGFFSFFPLFMYSSSGWLWPLVFW